MCSYFRFSYFTLNVFISAGDTDENTLSELQEYDETIGIVFY